MTESSIPPAEAPIHASVAAGDLARAAHLTFERYGPEVLTFLRLRLRSQDNADEVFAMFAEDLWSGISGFEFRCTMRCWVYILARNAANRFAAAPQQQVQRRLPLSQHPSALAYERATRTHTQAYRQTESKQRVRALRERLAHEDQLLLVLHIDRGLPFRELALVMSEHETLAEDALVREAARLRKRFERIKLELRAMAIEAGLLRR